jgi:5-methylcytosine-specific restriction endonuclease McrA
VVNNIGAMPPLFGGAEVLLSKTVKIKWNSKNKKHYTDLGYEYTGMKTEFEAKIEDLTSGCQSLIEVICDYCGEKYETKYYVYLVCKKREVVHKDCCEKECCTTQKAHESIVAKYGVDNVRELNFVNEKIAKTNVEKYGCENPFGNKRVMEKIYNTNIEKYGSQIASQSQQVKEKIKKTMLEKYGVSNYSKTSMFRESMRKENNPRYKDYIPKRERTERRWPEYREWRFSVFARDNFTCQCCGDHNYTGRNGGSIWLEAHHLYNYADNKDKIFDLDNGVTLCKACHLLFHSQFGKKNNTPEQFQEFLKNNSDILTKKIC